MDYYGLPPPPLAFGQPLALSVGDVVELTACRGRPAVVGGERSLLTHTTHTGTGASLDTADLLDEPC